MSAIARKYEGGGQWTEVIDEGTSSRGREQVTPNTGSNSTPSTTTTVAPPTQGTNVGTDAEREYKTLERNVLVGDVNMREANPKIKAKQTVRLEGFGKFLTGLYLVERVTHKFSKSDGYTQTVGVRRNGFGDSLKKAMVEVTPPPAPTPPRNEPVTPPVQKKTYTVVKGDNLSKIARKYGTTWQKIYEANKGIIGKNPNLIYPGQTYTIP